MKILRYIAIPICTILLSTSAMSQSTLNTSYGVSFDDKGDLTYKVGNVIYSCSDESKAKTKETTDPFKIYSVGIGEGPVNIMLETYRDPFSNILLLTSTDQMREDMYYEIFNAQGDLLDKKDLMGLQTKISFDEFIVSTFYLRVTNGAMGERVFKVLKS